MTAWENMTKAIKTAWTETKQYFEGLVCNFKIYKQNSSGILGNGKYESANQTAKATKKGQTQALHCHHPSSSGCQRQQAGQECCQHLQHRTTQNQQNGNVTEAVKQHRCHAHNSTCQQRGQWWRQCWRQW
jgi:hypothetical protein